MDKPKITRVVMIDAQFPELKGGACNQRGKGMAASVKAAGARAFANLLRQPKLRRKHFTTFTAIVTVGKIVEVPEESQ